MNEAEEREALRDALAEGAPGEEQRAAMARRALALAAARPRRAVPWARVAVAAAALGALALFWPRAERPPPAPLGGASEAEERAANEALLARPVIARWVEERPEGTWIAVVGGGTAADADLGALLRRIEEEHPHARHRFLFRKGTEGDCAYEITFGDHPWAGTRFLAAADLTLSGAGGEEWLFARGEKTARFPSPDGRPWVPVSLSLPGREGGRTLPFVVSTGSACPLLLPEDAVFPLAEIPGKATIRGIGKPVEGCTRYLLRARIPALGLETVLEGVAVPGMRETRVLGGAAWRRTKAGARARPLLLLALHGEAPPWLDALLKEARGLAETHDLEFTTLEDRDGRGTPVLARLSFLTKEGVEGRALALEEGTPAETVRRFLRADDEK